MPPWLTALRREIRVDMEEKIRRYGETTPDPDILNQKN